MSAPTETIRVLHVDDEREFTSLTATLLEREDERIRVQTATGPEGGLETLAENEIDCIVSDYDMPGRNGVEFLDAVRAEYPDLPFILFTGKGSEEVASEAISAGVSDYLQKEGGTDQYTVLANRITNAVAAARSQRDRERQLDAIETAQEGISILDGDGRFDYVNEAYADLYGYEPKEMVGEHWGLIYLDEDVPYIREEILPEVKANGNWHGRTTGLRADGSTFVEDHALAMTERGELVCSVREVSEGDGHELKKTNALLSTLFDTLPQGVLAKDESREVLAINQRMFDLFGISGSAEAVIGTDGERLTEEISELLVDSAEFIARTDELVAERKPVDNEELTLRDGRTLERTHRPLELLDGDAHLWIYREVTERKTREEELQTMQGRLEALNQTTRELVAAETRTEVAQVGVETTRDLLDLEANAIHLYDEKEDGLVPVAVTDAAYDLVGDPPTFTEGDSIAWRVYESGEALAIDNIREDPDIYNPETPARSELYLPVGEHGVLIATSTETGTFDQQDVLLGEILAGNIATVLGQVEGTERLRAREQELTAQNDRLEQFTSIVSHDLRNPLNVAELRLELADEECDSEHLMAVENAHDRMRGLIEDLLTLARDGTESSELTMVALSDLVDGCWANVDTAGATLVTDVDRTVRTDEGRLKQMFENLIRNAVEHGGEKVTVTVGELDDGFYVTDDGPGIPTDDRHSVFEAGYSTSEAGTGFGLSIVEQIVDAHDWEISVTEGADGGARFEITGVEFVD